MSTTTDTSRVELNQPFSEYRAAEGVNQSMLKLIVNRSPAHYLAAYEASDEQEETDALRLGSLLHVTTFEPQYLLQWYVTMPAFETYPEVLDSRTAKGEPFKNPKVSTAYKKLAADFRETNSDKEIIPADQFAIASGVYNQLCQHDRTKEYLKAGDSEAGVFWTDPQTGIRCKARFDKWDQSRRLIVDLKTTRDAQDFSRSIVKFGYDFQAAWYCWGAEVITGEPHEFAIIAAEKSPPYGVRAAKFGEETMIAGRKKIRRALDLLAECDRTGDWPCYKDPVEWNLPGWALVDDEPAILKINGEEVSL